MINISIGKIKYSKNGVFEDSLYFKEFEIYEVFAQADSYNQVIEFLYKNWCEYVKANQLPPLKGGGL